MANIIRCKLPDGIHRFKPFTVADYRDFLLVRNDMATRPEEEHAQILDELIDDYFSEYPSSWAKYIFLQVFTSSIGKTKVPIVYECPTCGKKHKRLFNLSQDDYVNPTVKISDDLEIIFSVPDEIDDNAAELLYKNLYRIKFKGKEYNWTDLDQDTKNNIVELITQDVFEEIIKKLKPIYFEITLGCCERHTLKYDTFESVFKLLINPDEIFPFYEINNILVKNNYGPDAIMNMKPFERNIVLALIEKEAKNK